MRPAKPRLPKVWPKTQVKALFVPRRIRQEALILALFAIHRDARLSSNNPARLERP